MEQAVERFLHTVAEDQFIEASEGVLKSVDDPHMLADCANLATQRQYGGAYYRARFWYKIQNTCQGDANLFRSVCRRAGIKQGEARRYVRLGEALSNLDVQGVSTKQLRSAHNKIFHFAAEQKDKSIEYLKHALVILIESPNSSPTKIHHSWCQLNGSKKANLDIIKPSDWWAFGRPKWRREKDFPGSIPGEIYANALYYFAPPRGVAVDAMAGSGMLERVYTERDRWQKDRKFELEIHLFDLFPKRDFIRKHDARRPLPLKADWIFLDPPYFGQSHHLFDGSLAKARDYREYIGVLDEIIGAMSYSLNVGGRLCILVPKWSGHSAEQPNHNVPTDVYQLATSHGLAWVDFASVSRGRQQESNGAVLNVRAKRIRRMRSDTAILNVFEKARE